MAGNMTQSQVVAGAAALRATGHKTILCKAFRNAVANWCRDRTAKNKKGNFNDYFYRSLAAQKPGGARGEYLPRGSRHLSEDRGGQLFSRSRDRCGRRGSGAAMGRCVLGVLGGQGAAAPRTERADSSRLRSATRWDSLPGSPEGASRTCTRAGQTECSPMVPDPAAGRPEEDGGRA